MKAFLKLIIPFFDTLISPLVLGAAIVLKLVRSIGIRYFPVSRKIFDTVGVFPIINHYYEPLFDKKTLAQQADQKRVLTGINWNIEGQLRLLNQFTYQDELQSIPSALVNELEFHFNNALFESGDAEYWYQLIRLKKPTQIIEIGSGNSTKLARAAIRKNEMDDPKYRCRHICIEPYEMPWLEKLGVEVVREKVETIHPSFFASLGENDILFIDSSHMVRPHGDVLFEFLSILPTLNSGVIVHVHDIFSPRDYLKEWVVDFVRFWNEQYILEAFLSCNSEWKVIGALNLLKHEQYDSLKEKCPYLSRDREPGSFYIQKV
jgi:hypothetical protein